MFTELDRICWSFRACHGRSAKSRACLIFHQTSTTLDSDCGSVHLDAISLCLVIDTSCLVLYCYRLVVKHLLASPSFVCRHHSMTGCGTIPTLSLQVCDCRFGNFAAGQAENIPGQNIKGNEQGGYINRQAEKCVRQSRFILQTMAYQLWNLWVEVPTDIPTGVFCCRV